MTDYGLDVEFGVFITPASRDAETHRRTSGHPRRHPGVDHALVDHINHPDDYRPIQSAIDALTDSLLSHLSYEEHEIVEPLARLCFYPGQV